MPEPVIDLKIDDDYEVSIHYDDDPMNPFKDWDGAPKLVLHDRAENHFGWTNDEDWQETLTRALDQIAERGHTTHLYGERGALDVVRRWLRAFHGMQVVLPVSGLDHSGHVAYLGDGAHWCDPGGWDSGWVGWLFYTGDQIAEMWPEKATDKIVEKSLRDSFTEFASYVSGSVYGYEVIARDGHSIDDDSGWGFYGDDSYGDGGYMREAFMDVIERDRTKVNADQSEIDEMRLAEVGAR